MSIQLKNEVRELRDRVAALEKALKELNEQVQRKRGRPRSNKNG